MFAEPSNSVWRKRLSLSQMANPWSVYVAGDVQGNWAPDIAEHLMPLTRTKPLWIGWVLISIRINSGIQLCQQS
jgi:hypothetical protein